MFKRLFGSQDSGLIEVAFRDVSSMMSQAGRMFDLALRSLLDNQPLTADLEQMDDSVDEGERMVRRTVLHHLAVNPEQDLVASLVLASMVQDAERIGDFARGLGELVKLARSPRQGPFRDQLSGLAGELRPLFDECELAFRSDDPEKAKAVLDAHLDLKEEFKNFRRSVADSDLDANMAVVYASAAQIMRRISAHLSNIASTVVQPYDKIRSEKTE